MVGCSKYFPEVKAEDAEEAEVKATETKAAEAKTVEAKSSISDGQKTSTGHAEMGTEVQSSRVHCCGELKYDTCADPAVDTKQVTVDEDDDWVNIDKKSVPHATAMEEADSEEEGGKKTA
jgi:hypothetical protein